MQLVTGRWHKSPFSSISIIDPQATRHCDVDFCKLHLVKYRFCEQFDSNWHLLQDVENFAVVLCTAPRFYSLIPSSAWNSINQDHIEKDARNADCAMFSSTNERISTPESERSAMGRLLGCQQDGKVTEGS
jgi:hypothetical protein